MKLKELLELLNESSLDIEVYLPCNTIDENPEIRRVTSDSRNVKEGDMFACVKGETFDGHDFAQQAIQSGAKLLLCEKLLDINIIQVICNDVRRNMGIVASLLYGIPSKKLKMIALTGTNGKTTTSFMVKAILDSMKVKTGLLGSLFYNDGDVVVDAGQTTPEASDLQQWLLRMVENKCEVCVMEASSHAIQQGRLEGTTYDRIGFGNLTADHLDYHGDMEQYFFAKKALFECYTKSEWLAAINIDDLYAKRLVTKYPNRIITFSTKDISADFFASIEEISIEGMKIKIKIKENKAEIDINLPLLGDYNVHNALESLAITSSIGVEVNQALHGLSEMKQIPGRLERYFLEDKKTCVIDFAHSPDSLEKVLLTLKELCVGELYVVFGAGGDRDKKKRPIMGEIAGKLADKVFITSDNPRTENPHLIISEIEKGIKRSCSNYELITNRKKAIEKALSELSANDILLVAGRGPERFQLFKNKAIPLQDKDVLFDWCRANSIEVL